MVEGSGAVSHPAWLVAFRNGDRATIENCYREYFDVVDKEIARVLCGADRDTAVHEVFFKLISRADVRESFAGRNLAAWLATMARHHAIDFARRRGREVGGAELAVEQSGEQTVCPECTAAAREILAMFGARLPASLRPVFEQRFVEQRSQRDAARALGMPRMTLAYKEKRIRALLDRFATEIDA